MVFLRRGFKGCDKRRVAKGQLRDPSRGSIYSDIDESRAVYIFTYIPYSSKIEGRINEKYDRKVSVIFQKYDIISLATVP